MKPNKYTLIKILKDILQYHILNNQITDLFVLQVDEYYHHKAMFYDDTRDIQMNSYSEQCRQLELAVSGTSLLHGETLAVLLAEALLPVLHLTRIKIILD